MSSLILSGCGPQPENKESQQQQPSTPTEQQVLAAQQAAIKRLSKAPPPRKPWPSKKCNNIQTNRLYRAIAGSANICKRAAKAKATYRKSGTARYQQFDDNPVKQVAQNPLATFSLDVDTGSYANVRRFLNQGLLPPPDAVRVEEIVNYFPSDWDIKDKQSIPASKPIPFAMRYELAPAHGMNSEHC